LGTIYENLPGASVVVSYVDDDVQAQPAMSSDGFIHAREKHWNERLELRALFSRT
jgi:hypothetical protein